MKPLVIDASVVLKWYLSDEEHGDSALDILDSHAAGRLMLHAPALLEFEVANGLVVAKRRARGGNVDLAKAMEGFVELGIELHQLSSFADKVIACAERDNISAYDAAYVALAEDLKARFVTADKRLFNSASRHRFVRWIGDFRV